MSAIDQYCYTCLGIVHCPSTYPIMYGNNDARDIPIYRLDEDVPPDEQDFQGKKGDILLGGGSGESAAMRIAIPEAFFFWTQDDWDSYQTLDEIMRTYWTPTESFVFGEGYSKLNWMPETSCIEWWLTHHILSFLAKHYPDGYQQYFGSEPLEEDGSICRLPTTEEQETLRPPRYVVAKLPKE